MAQHGSHLLVSTATLAGSCLALLMAGVPIAAADAQIETINRAQMLLAARGYRIAPVVVIKDWPSNALTTEAIALAGTIYVNTQSNILRAAVRSRAYDVVLASLLLHEHSHVLGANEQQALETELAWLTSERAAQDFIQATRRAIEREKQKRRRPRS